MIDDTTLQHKLAEINALINPYGCTATGFGADAVAVMGDARVVGASVLVTFPPDATPEIRRSVADLIINRVRGIARVLMDIPVAGTAGGDRSEARPPIDPSNGTP